MDIDNAFIHKEFFRMMIGKQIGRGMSRAVYAFKNDPTLVIKVEEASESFQNVREWEYWQENKDFKPVAQWLAPCHYISPCGTILVQSRVGSLEKSAYPKIIPHFFTDTKYQNFGTLKGKTVCFDYGNIPLSKGIEIKKGKVKMVKAEWWGDQEIL